MTKAESINLVVDRSIAARMGKRVLILNSVNAIPAPDVNGIQLNDWSVHVTGRHFEPTSFPPEIVESLEREFPGDPFAETDCGSSDFVDAERLVNSISANLARKKMAFSKLIDFETWDHVHIGIDDLHNLGHVVWDAFDEKIPPTCSCAKRCATPMRRSELLSIARAAMR